MQTERNTLRLAFRSKAEEQSPRMTRAQLKAPQGPFELVSWHESFAIMAEPYRFWVSQEKKSGVTSH